MNQDNNNLLQSFLHDEAFGSLQENFEKNNEGSIVQNIRSGNYQVIDSRFQYGNCQLFLETKTNAGTWLVSLTKGFGSGEYGTRSLMNDLFHLARLRAQTEGDKVSGLAIAYRDKDKANHPPLMSLRAQAALAVLKNWPNIQQGQLSVRMEASTFEEEGIEADKKWNEEKLERKLVGKYKKEGKLAERQVRVSLKSSSSSLRSLAIDAVVLGKNSVELLELKKDYLGREAFVELLQNAYFPLYLSEAAGALFRGDRELPVANIPSKNDVSRPFKEHSFQMKQLILRGVGKGYPVGNCTVGFEFELMKQQLLDNRNSAEELQILFV